MSEIGDDRKVLLAGADCRAGLGVARSLSRSGFVPIAAVADPRSFVTYSRCLPARQCFATPSPMREPQQYLAALRVEAIRYGCKAVIPITDAVLGLLQNARDQWPVDVPIIGPSAEAADAVLDKNMNIEVAERLDIPCPQTLQIESEADIEAALAEHPLPWVMKLPNRAVSLPESVKHFTVLFTHTAAEVRTHLQQLWGVGVKPQIQRFFAGNMHVLCCFMAKGNLVASHEYVSLRRNTHAGVLRVITPANPDCHAYAERLLRDIGWEGVACVQFLIDERRGEICYLETIGRFWASVQGSIHAGWDFPTWAVRYFLDAAVPTPPPLQIGSQTCYHTEDLNVLVDFLKGGPSPSLDHTPTKLSAVVNYLAAFGPKVHSDVFSWRDPVPSLIDHLNLVRRRLKSLRQVVQ